MQPGKVLADKLEMLGVTPTELSRQIAVPPNRISQTINGKRAITGDAALRLAHWFKTRPEFWQNLQTENLFEVRPSTLLIFQSPAMAPGATPVILPAASKPNNRLVASPRGKTNFRTVKV